MSRLWCDEGFCRRRREIHLQRRDNFAKGNNGEWSQGKKGVVVGLGKPRPDAGKASDPEAQRSGLSSFSLFPLARCEGSMPEVTSVKCAFQ